MTTESFEGFRTWFESTNQGKWIEKAVPSFEGEKIGLKCLHCHQFFPVTQQSSGKGWHIGSFVTRHLNSDKVCPNQVPGASMSMDTSDNVTMTLDFIT